jgi:hypothetical protein
MAEFLNNRVPDDNEVAPCYGEKKGKAKDIIKG